MEGGGISRPGLIGDYLRELRGELRLPRHTRERVLAEVSDHLVSATERAGIGTGADAGPAEAAQRAAIDAFGPPRLVALRFSEELCVAQARRVTSLTVLVTVLFSAFIALDSPWRSSALGRVFGVMSIFAVQIALTCAALSLIRAVRHRHDRAVPVGKLRWILRGDAVALGCVLLTAATGVAAALLSGHPADHAGVLVRAGATIVLALPALVALARGRFRVGGLAALADAPPPPGDDALADVSALVGEVQRWAVGRPGVGRVTQTLERLARSPLVEAPARALSLRAHPWRAAVALAVLAGAALGLGHAFSEAGPPSPAALPRAGAAFAILLVTEGSAVIACFAALGGFLGIRRREPVDSSGSA